MYTIVLFGAGKSATVLIGYLKKLAADKYCKIIVADADLAAIQTKLGSQESAEAVRLDISQEKERRELIRVADVIISLLPPGLHGILAKDCLLLRRHLLTASYISDELKKLEPEILQQKLLFLCEMGLDPGIDHMSAMRLIHQIQRNQGKIRVFRSHCGGLVAPESDDNPWHYKISWNSRNVVLAGKAGADYQINGKRIHQDYLSLFDNNPQIKVPGIGTLAYYPNRDSLSYADRYRLHDTDTFIRTTLRHPDFCKGWKFLIELGLTNEEKKYATDGLTVARFFKQYFEEIGSRAFSKGVTGNFSLPGSAKEFSLLFSNFLGTDSLQDADLLLEQLRYLGIADEDTFINKGLCSAADILQRILETKLLLRPDDRDMVVMVHEIEYETGSKVSRIVSRLVVRGTDALHTAMAKTVGLPLGIAAKLILENKIQERGLLIPVLPAIYLPVLQELESQGIRFEETTA